MPLFGLTRCGRKALPSTGSRASSGASNRLPERRLALRRLDCLRFGLAMIEICFEREHRGRCRKRPFTIGTALVKVGPEGRQELCPASDRPPCAGHRTSCDLWEVLFHPVGAPECPGLREGVASLAPTAHRGVQRQVQLPDTGPDPSNDPCQSTKVLFHPVGVSPPFRASTIAIRMVRTIR